MRSISGLAAAAIVAGSAFAAFPAHSADRLSDSAMQRVRSAHSEFRAGQNLYDKGHFAAGLAAMERSLPILKEILEDVTPMGFGGLQDILVEFYMNHGCYHQAVILAEQDVGFLDAVPYHTELHDRWRSHYAAAVRRTGQTQRAIEMYKDILKKLGHSRSDEWHHRPIV